MGENTADDNSEFEGEITLKVTVGGRPSEERRAIISDLTSALPKGITISELTGVVGPVVADTVTAGRSTAEVIAVQRAIADADVDQFRDDLEKIIPVV